MSAERLLESNSRKHGLKRSRKFLVFLATAMLLLALTIVVAALSTQWVTYPGGDSFIEIHADKLADKPQSYLSLSNPDPYLLEALSSPGKYVDFDSFDETQIDEQIGKDSISYVEFEGSYYKIYLSVVFVDFPPAYNRGEFFQLPIVILWLFWGISAVIVYLHRR